MFSKLAAQREYSIIGKFQVDCYLADAPRWTIESKEMTTTVRCSSVIRKKHSK